jgi:hypothetical protein
MSLFKNKTKDEAIEIILRHYSIACEDRINTLDEERAKESICWCDIRIEGCDNCSFWRAGVLNYQQCLEDIKEFKKLYMED